MNNIETGKHLPSLKLFVELALNVGLNPSDLFKEIVRLGILEEIRKKTNSSED